MESFLALNAIVLVLGLSFVTGASIKNCRCVPDQWQGILSSQDREFDLKGGRTSKSDTNLLVHYDYLHKKFSMTDLKSGNKAVADYNKGYKYVIRPDGCRAIKTYEDMRQMCLPENAKMTGEYVVGTEIPVSVWEFTGPYNLTMKTAVIQNTCMPMSEEVYMERDGLASVTNSMYLDMVVGIEDPLVFEAPVKCMFDAERSRQMSMMREKINSGNAAKRSESPLSLYKLLEANSD